MQNQGADKTSAEIPIRGRKTSQFHLLSIFIAWGHGVSWDSSEGHYLIGRGRGSSYQKTKPDCPRRVPAAATICSLKTTVRLPAVNASIVEGNLRKILFAAVALCACSIAFEASSQPIAIDRKQISAAAARKMVDACLAYAEKNNALVAVAVVDIAGVLMDFHAMQGAGPTVAETAILKAKTA